jgi:succinoglycan biosynthesis transport protein ExoP
MDEKLQKLTEKLRGAPGPMIVERESAATAPPSVDGVLDDDFALRDYWRVLHARRRTVYAALATAFVLVTAYNYVTVPVYRATATLQVDREQPNIAEFDPGRLQQIPEQPDYLETQYKVLRSRTLAKRVIAAEALSERRELNYGIDSTELAAEPDFVHPEVMKRFLKHLGVSPAKGTRLLDVSYESVDPELSARVVNHLTRLFIEHNLETKWNATQQASTWLREQLSSLEQRLQESETQLREYATAHAILFLEERKDVTTEKLAQLEDELTRAEAERIERQSFAMLAEDAVRSGRTLPASLTSQSLEELGIRLTDAQRELASLETSFGPGYPKLQRAASEVRSIESAVEVERRRLLQGVQENFELAKNREGLLAQAAGNQRVSVNRLNGNFIQYNILKRDAETNRALYEGLLQRLKEAGISAGLRASNIAVLDRAEVPDEPARPAKLFNYALGLCAGLLIGVCVGFVQENMHAGLRTPDEVAELTGLSLLAVVPRGAGDEDKKVSLVPAGSKSNWEPERALSEAYRTLRGSVLLGREGSIQRILFTSAQPQEGKTTLSLNLACSLAQLGKRVLVIDADMRRPDCSRQLGIKAEAGLREFLEEEVEADAIVYETALKNLWMIPAGKSTGVASDLLYSPRLRTLLNSMSEKFEHIVIDTPPSLVLSDARTIAPLADAVVMVVSDSTNRAALLRTTQIFSDAGIPFLGYVMNRVSLDTLDYGYYRDYGYEYAYGETREERSESNAA